MARKRKKPVCWSVSVGEEPHTVYVFERYPGSQLYVQAWNPVTKRRPKKSLGHKDRERAKEEAQALHSTLMAGAPVPSEPGTVGAIIAAYLTHRTPNKPAETSQRDDRRRGAMWMRVLGTTRKVSTLGRAEWESFVAARTSGAINAKGAPVIYVTDGPRIPVEARTVDADLVFLNAVFNWALSWNGRDGVPLLKKNPWGAAAPGVKRALERPRTASPARPVATYDRFLALRAVGHRVLMETRRGDPEAELVQVGTAMLGPEKKTEGPVMKWMKPSYFVELLELAEQTGRRISAICRLSYDRLRWDAGVITQVKWPPLKGESERWVPISDETRETLMRVLAQRPGIGPRWMFPSPRKPGQPMSKRLAHDWMERAEKLAGVPHLERGSWHPYRRKWGTERKHLPTKDVMAVGGWKDERSLRESYQHADEETMMSVVNEPGKLRTRGMRKA